MTATPPVDPLVRSTLQLMDLPPLRISYLPVDPDSVDYPVFVVRTDVAQNDDVLPLHWHRKGQLVFAERGSVMCRVVDGLWIVPSQGAVWVPGGVPHSNCVSDYGSILCVFIDPGAVELPKTCCTFAISPLVREIIYALVERPLHDPLEGPTSRLATVLLDELVQMPTDRNHLPIPSDPRLRQIAESMLENPADRSTVSEWAARMAMSERSLSRLVVNEIGLTFGRWRRRLHILIAVQRLSAGASVQTVSQDLGYESPSAFIIMFKKVLGKPPRQYLLHKVRY